MEIPANALLVNDTVMSTNLVHDGVKIGTVEHLMSALAGLGIDNAVIEVSAAEIPIMDGSAGPFVFLLQAAGIIEQRAQEFNRGHGQSVRQLGGGDQDKSIRETRVSTLDLSVQKEMARHRFALTVAVCLNRRSTVIRPKSTCLIRNTSELPRLCGHAPWVTDRGRRR